MDEWQPNHEPGVGYAEVLSVGFHFVLASPVKVSETMLEVRLILALYTYIIKQKFLGNDVMLTFREVHSVNMQVESTYPSLL